MPKLRNAPTISAVANDNPSFTPGPWQPLGMIPDDVPISTVTRRKLLEAYPASISSRFRIQMRMEELEKEIFEVMNKKDKDNTVRRP